MCILTYLNKYNLCDYIVYGIWVYFGGITVSIFLRKWKKWIKSGKMCLGVDIVVDLIIAS